MLVQRLIALRRNVLTYYSLPEEGTELFIRHNMAVMFGNYGTQQLNSLRQAGADVGYAIPREGVLAWLDCWAMTTSARNPQLAQQWINYMLEPAVSALLPTRQGLANTLTASAELPPVRACCGCSPWKTRRGVKRCGRKSIPAICRGASEPCAPVCWSNWRCCWPSSAFLLPASPAITPIPSTAPCWYRRRRVIC
jgi:hypothetical protein